MRTDSSYTMVHSDSGVRRRDWIAVIVLFLFSIVIRFVGHVHKVVYVNLSGDMIHYNNAAQMIVKKHVFAYWGTAPSVQVTPGYPLFLALCKWIYPHLLLVHGGDLKFAIWVQASLSSLVAGILFLVARRFLSFGFALIPGVLWAVYPPAAWSSTLILTETLYIFFLCAFVLSFYIAMERDSAWWWGVAGLLLGLTTIVRPTTLPLVLAALVYLLVRVCRGEDSIRRAAGKYALYVAGLLISMLPWWIRNAIVFHKLILTSDDLGNPLLFGADPNFLAHPEVANGLSASKQQSFAIRHIIDGFTHHPFVTLKWYTLDKLGLMFGHPWYPKPYSPQLMAMHLTCVILGALGIIAAARVPKTRWLLALTVFLVVVQLPFIPIERYVLPILPMLFVGVGLFLQEVWRLVSKRRPV